jgi:hypothetical protein
MHFRSASQQKTDLDDFIISAGRIVAVLSDVLAVESGGKVDAAPSPR